MSSSFEGKMYCDRDQEWHPSRKLTRGRSPFRETDSPGNQSLKHFGSSGPRKRFSRNSHSRGRESIRSHQGSGVYISRPPVKYSRETAHLPAAMRPEFTLGPKRPWYEDPERSSSSPDTHRQDSPSGPQRFGSSPETGSVVRGRSPKGKKGHRRHSLSRSSDDSASLDRASTPKRSGRGRSDCKSLSSKCTRSSSSISAQSARSRASWHRSCSRSSTASEIRTHSISSRSSTPVGRRRENRPFIRRQSDRVNNVERPACGAGHGERPWGWRGRGRGGPPRGSWRGRRGGGPFFNRGGGYGFRNSWEHRSPSCDSEEEYRRSRSREKARRRKQYETIQKYCKTSEGEQQVFWDGFQWVRKSDREGQLLYDQQMNATRRARRLHVGNLPLNLEEVTEDDLKRHLWHAMRSSNACKDPATCPVLHVWFARDRGGNYGFVEMASVEEAHAALRLDGMLWHGVSIRINRPTDWKNTIAEDLIFGPLAGTSGLALAESIAAAAQQAASTGNNAGLVSLIASLPEEQRPAAMELVAKHTTAQQSAHLPFDLIHSQIRAELLKGQPSRIVQIMCPSTNLEREEEYDEILNDILTECNKHGHALAALIIKPKLEEFLPSVTVGDVYLEYASCIQADNIILNFSGRMYDGKPLQLQRFNELAWRQTFQQYATHLLSQFLTDTIDSVKPTEALIARAAQGDQKSLVACTAGASAAMAFLSGAVCSSRPYGPQPKPPSDSTEPTEVEDSRSDTAVSGEESKGPEELKVNCTIKKDQAESS
ncbi:splicing factor [Cystoisospora suis]|uniref:Splicing factor n=1 Tax=Cystoisospora suis TaxID=483139 RepID=A0A2C6KIY6_9APIC|nr:splicing factor [Cystoisospora suis]